MRELAARLLAMAELSVFKGAGTDEILRSAARDLLAGRTNVLKSFQLKMFSEVGGISDEHAMTCREASRALQI
jgi:hypothetical protein